MEAVKKWWYWAALAACLLTAGWLRVAYTDTSRELIVGDETTYWYAAKSIVDHDTLIRNIDGSMYRLEVPLTPTPALSPGYPVFIALVLEAGGDVRAVLTANIVLNMIALGLMLLTMQQLGLARLPIVLALAAAALYPGLINNLDRMLTEQLFLALFMGFVYCSLRGMIRDRLAWTLAAGLVLGLAVHVRAQALPFAALAAAFIVVVVPAKRVSRHIGVLVLGLVLIMAPWWIRNALTFDRLLLLTDAGQGAAVWGSVPYFLDMSTVDGDVADVVARNMPPAPDVYYRWRVFGFLHFMWGDIWNEQLAHPIRDLRKLMLLHPVAVVLPLLLSPLAILRRNLPALFIACIPMLVTLLAMPFHGLPRYAYPSVPFAIMILALLLSPTQAVSTKAGVANWQVKTGKWLAGGFLGASIVFSVLLAYTLGVFALDMSKEMSSYRLARYLGTSIEQLGPPAAEQTIDLTGVPVENTTTIRPGRLYNSADGPAIIKLDIPKLGGARVVTEVQLFIQGGYYFDRTTIYWRGTNTPEITENAHYRFPNNPLRTTHTIYIDDDVEHLMVVPFVFRWGKFNVDKVVVRKYVAPP